MSRSTLLGGVIVPWMDAAAFAVRAKLDERAGRAGSTRRAPPRG